MIIQVRTVFFLFLASLTLASNFAVEELGVGVEFPVEASGGARPWTITRVASHDGVDSIRSGEIEQGASSSVQIRVQGPGRLSFWWKVSTYPDEYSLAVYLDGAEQTKVSGEVDWQQRVLFIPAGVHEVEWRYDKGFYGGWGTDAGWLDQIQFQPEVEDLPKVAQSITFPAREGDAAFPVELPGSATSFLPVTFSIVQGPAFLREHILIPTGSGTVRVRATQAGNHIFAPAEPVEQNFAFAANPPNPLAADTPDISLTISTSNYRRVQAAGFQPDGKLIIAGVFKEIGGVARTNIARLNQDGTLDLTWRPHIPRSEITSVVVKDDWVYVAGSIYEVNGVGRSAIARISTKDNGSLDSAWAVWPQGGVWKMLDFGEDLILAGDFRGISGHQKSFLAKVSLAGNGAIDPLWGPAPNASVLNLALHGTNLFFSGAFTEVGGAPIPYLAKASALGRGDADPGWKVAFPFLPYIRALMPTETGLLVGGNFTLEPVQGRFYGLYQFSLDTGRLLASRFENMPVTTVEFHNQRLYTAFNSTGDLSQGSPFLLRLDPATLEPDSDWHAKSARPFILPGARSGSPLEIFQLAFRNEDLWAVGSFSSLAGSPSSGVALLPTFEGSPSVTPATTSRGFVNSTGLQISAHSSDEIETTYYRISGVQNGTLFRKGATAPIQDGEFITKADGAAGLQFLPNNGFTGTAQFEVQAASAPRDFAAGGTKALASVLVLDKRIDQSLQSTPLSDVLFSTGFVDLDFTSTSGLPVELSVTGPVSRTGNRLTFTGVGLVSVIANQAGNEIYAPVTPVEQTFVVLRGVQQITFEPITGVRYGMTAPLRASSSSGLPITFSVVAGAAAISNQSVTFQGVGRMVLRAAHPGNDTYEPAQIEQEISVARGIQSITFPPMPARPFDAKPLLLEAVASSGLPVTYRVLGGPATIQDQSLLPTAAGAVRVEAFQAGNEYYEPAVAEETVIFEKLEQTLSFQRIVPPIFTNRATLTNIAIELVATTSTGLPADFWVQSGPAQITLQSGRHLLSFLKPGSIVVNAQQPGNEVYNGSPVASQSITVPKILQSIDFPPIAETRLDAESLRLEASASSGLAVQFRALSGPGVVRTNELALAGTGTIRLVAEQSGDDFFAMAAVTNSVTVLKGRQAITFDLPSTQVLIDNLRLSAASSSGLPVSYAIVSGPASLISSNLVRFQATGTVSIAASQAGNANYEAAASVLRTMEIVRAGQNITFAPIADHRWNEGPLTLIATNSSGLPVAFELVSGPANLSGKVLQMTGSGQITVRAFHPGTDLFAPGEAIRMFNARPVPQTISFAAISDTRFSDGPATIQPTSSSGLPVEVVVVSGPALWDAKLNRCTPTGVGAVVLRARQAGNQNYLAAASVDRSFTILKGIQTIQFGAIPTAHVNTPILLEATATSGLPVQFGILSGPAILSTNRLMPIAVGEVVVVAMQLGDARYEAAPLVEQVVTITRGEPSLHIGRDGSTGVLRWDSLFSDYRLEQSPTLGPAGWAPATGSPTSTEGILSFRVPLQGTRWFYRLVRTGP